MLPPDRDREAFASTATRTRPAILSDLRERTLCRPGRRSQRQWRTWSRHRWHCRCRRKAAGGTGGLGGPTSSGGAGGDSRNWRRRDGRRRRIKLLRGRYVLGSAKSAPTASAVPCSTGQTQCGTEPTVIWRHRPTRIIAAAAAPSAQQPLRAAAGPEVARWPEAVWLELHRIAADNSNCGAACTVRQWRKELHQRQLRRHGVPEWLPIRDPPRRRLWFGLREDSVTEDR